MKIMRSILAVAVMSVGVAAYPQNPQSWKVNIPFDFTVRHTNLEAGTYTVRQSGPVVMLTSQDGKTANVFDQQRVHVEAGDSIEPDLQRQRRRIRSGPDQEHAGSNTELKAVVSKRTHRQLEASIPEQTVEVAALGTR